MRKISGEPVNAREFDAYFEDHDIAHLLDTRTRRVNIDVPAAFLRRLDLRAAQIGLTRQALIKYWLAERLELVPKAR